MLIFFLKINTIIDVSTRVAVEHNQISYNPDNKACASERGGVIIAQDINAKKV